MNSKEYFQKLIYAFLLLFGFVLVVGVVLTCISVQTVPISQTTINAAVKETQLSFKISTGVPGIVLTLLGTIGLLTLLIKIPVKQAVQVISRRDSDPSASFSLLSMTTGFGNMRTEFIDHRIPILLYWILKAKMNLTKSE